MQMFRTRIGLAIVAAVLTTWAGTGDAGLFQPSARGTLEIKGTRWEDGVQEKVVCQKKEGHTLLSTAGQWNVDLEPGGRCLIAADGPSFEFTGSQAQVIKNGKPQLQLVIGAVEGAVAGLSGQLGGRLFFKKDGTLRSAKGTILYVVPGPAPIVFEGKFKVKF